MKGGSGGQPSRRQRETCRNRCDTGVGKNMQDSLFAKFFPTILAADEPRIDLRATPLTQSEGARTEFSTKNRTFGT